MMKTVIFNFERIGSIEDFYALAKKELALPNYFGKNLDALWDSITADISLPVTLRFTNLSMPQLEQFDQLISLCEEAAEYLGNDFVFEYYLRKTHA